MEGVFFRTTTLGHKNWPDFVLDLLDFIEFVLIPFKELLEILCCNCNFFALNQIFELQCV